MKADEACAWENAVEEWKQIATGVIMGNDRDGVAHWLKNNYKENQGHL